MTIYEVLKEDHMKLKSLLRQLVALQDDDADMKRAKILIRDIRDALIPHSRAEEAVFYNSLRLIDQAKAPALHGFAEHAEAESLLRALQVENLVHADLRKTALKLQEAVLHHIQEEETKIFSIARQLFTHDEAEGMVEPFEELKSNVEEEGFMQTTLDLVVNLMPPRLSGALGLSN
jgi:hemerythrin-like domain-containing protein